MTIPDHVLESILQRVDIVSIVSRYTSLQRKGDRYWGCCPFHNEKTPSFSVSPAKGMFYCFGCQKGGSLFTFLMETDKVSFPEAVERLAKESGVDLTAYKNESSTDKAENKERDALKELYHRIATSFSHILHTQQGKTALDYLVDRGTNEDSLINFRLGYCPEEPEWLFKFLASKNYSKEFLDKSGLFHKQFSRRAFFAGRIMFPIANRAGDIIAFGGRAMGDAQPKYLNSPESLLFKKSENLYGLHQSLDLIKKEKILVICEGYMDVIALVQSGIPAVAPLGTALTDAQVKLVKRYVSDVVLFFDKDAAGLKALKKAALLCEEHNLNWKVPSVSENQKDPSDVLKQRGSEALRSLVDASVQGFDFLIDFTFGKDEGREHSGRDLEGLVEFASSIQSPIRRDVFLQKISALSGVPITILRGEGSRTQKPAVTEPSGRRIAFGLDMQVVVFAALNSDLFPDIRKEISVDMLHDDNAKEIFCSIEEAYRNDKKSLEGVLDHLANIDLKHIIIKKALEEEYFLNREKTLRDITYRLKLREYEQKRRGVVMEIQKASQGQDEHLVQEMMQRKIALDETIVTLRKEWNE